MSSSSTIGSRTFWLCLAVSAALLISVSADEKDYVLTLDNSNFTDVVSKHDFIVVEFYAPWCQYSKKLAPEYEKAAKTLSSNDPPVVLAKVYLLRQVTSWETKESEEGMKTGR